MRIISKIWLTLYNYISIFIVMKTQFITELPIHWQDTALIFEALGSPVRQRILLIFEASEEITIKQVTELFFFFFTSIAFHLITLDIAGLLPRLAA